MIASTFRGAAITRGTSARLSHLTFGSPHAHEECWRLLCNSFCHVEAIMPQPWMGRPPTAAESPLRHAVGKTAQGVWWHFSRRFVVAGRPTKTCAKRASGATLILHRFWRAGPPNPARRRRRGGDAQRVLWHLCFSLGACSRPPGPPRAFPKTLGGFHPCRKTPLLGPFYMVASVLLTLFPRSCYATSPRGHLTYVD